MEKRRGAKASVSLADVVDAMPRTFARYGRGSRRRAVPAEVTTPMLNDSAHEGSHAIGIDVGGTKCAAGLVDVKSGRVFAWRLRPTEAAHGGDAVLADVIDLARSLQEEAARMGYQSVCDRRVRCGTSRSTRPGIERRDDPLARRRCPGPH